MPGRRTRQCMGQFVRRRCDRGLRGGESDHRRRTAVVSSARRCCISSGRNDSHGRAGPPRGPRNGTDDGRDFVEWPDHLEVGAVEGGGFGCVDLRTPTVASSPRAQRSPALDSLPTQVRPLSGGAAGAPAAEFGTRRTPCRSHPAEPFADELVDPLDPFALRQRPARAVDGDGHRCGGLGRRAHVVERLRRRGRHTRRGTTAGAAASRRESSAVPMPSVQPLGRGARCTSPRSGRGPRCDQRRTQRSRSVSKRTRPASREHRRPPSAAQGGPERRLRARARSRERQGHHPGSRRAHRGRSGAERSTPLPCARMHRPRAHSRSPPPCPSVCELARRGTDRNRT